MLARRDLCLEQPPVDDALHEEARAIAQASARVEVAQQSITGMFFLSHSSCGGRPGTLKVLSSSTGAERSLGGV